jgi:hypothetical protein
MKRILLAGMIAALALGPAMAQETCATKAVDKNGKPLAGAALNSFLKKCKREACEPKAVSAEGKKLSGAAKNSFMQKCERDAWVHAELSRPISACGDLCGQDTEGHKAGQCVAWVSDEIGAGDQPAAAKVLGLDVHRHCSCAADEVSNEGRRQATLGAIGRCKPR